MTQKQKKWVEIREEKSIQTVTNLRLKNDGEDFESISQKGLNSLKSDTSIINAAESVIDRVGSGRESKTSLEDIV